MYRKQLVAHISRELGQGLSRELIEAELVRDGWSQADIEESFRYAMHPELLEQFSFHRFLSSEMPAWIEAVSFFVTAAALAVTIMSLTYFRERVYSYELTLPDTPNIAENILHYGEQSTLSNKNFFTEVKDQFIADKVNFILADLAEMKVYLYMKGKLVKTMDILTKGKEGSWWETPAGLYKIETKEKSHFSSFGHVNQPWSMAFQGNFFIHGWPEYPNGKPVESVYSGGCIRLSNESAKELFERASVGMPVLVYEKDFSSDGKEFKMKRPVLSASNYLAADIDSDFVFLEKNAGTAVPIASVTKLMTALVATEFLNLEKKVTITESMIISTSKPRLSVGTKVSAYQLLFPLLMESSNEAAEALASMGGDRSLFMKRMNEKAAAIGMKHTVFTDPSGREEGNVSTPEDLFIFSKYLYHNRSFILNLSAGRISKSAYGAPQWKDLGNFNDFAGDESFIGGKVGESSSAKETELALFTVEIGTERRVVAVIVLGSSQRKSDVEAVRAFMQQSFQ
jgi:hypothetical protein